MLIHHTGLNAQSSSKSLRLYGLRKSVSVSWNMVVQKRCASFGLVCE
jgi:hypothetical protein